MLPVFPSPVSVFWSAFRAGGLAAVRLRASRRAGSGVVLACGFRARASAAAFAALWAARLGLSVAVRPVAGLWVVSVPVGCSVPFGAAGAGASAWWVSGGVRGAALVARDVSVAAL
jgi:hypothetical protein